MYTFNIHLFILLSLEGCKKFRKGMLSYLSFSVWEARIVQERYVKLSFFLHVEGKIRNGHLAISFTCSFFYVLKGVKR